jgi:hypothetical protein
MAEEPAVPVCTLLNDAHSPEDKRMTAKHIIDLEDDPNFPKSCTTSRGEN